MTRLEKNAHSFMKHGVPNDLAEKLAKHGYTVTKIQRKTPKKDLRQLGVFTDDEVDEIFGKIRGESMDRIEKNTQNFLKYGISSNLAEKLVQQGYAVSSIQGGASKKVLRQLGVFTDGEVNEIFEKVKRQPIPDDVMQKLISECELHCCFCWNINEEPSIIIHHIVEYNKSQDNSYGNLVVLCLNHHGDAHTKRQISQQNFPPSRQIHQKQKWIQAVKDYRQGLRIAPGSEKQLQESLKQQSRQDVIDTLTAAFTGHPKRFIVDAIENVSKASSKALEEIDPRFHIDISLQNNVILYSIRAKKEDVETQLRISPQFAKEFAEKYKNLIDHGEPLEIDSTSVSITGSKLLDIAFANQEGRFKMIPQYQKPAVQKMSLINLDMKATYALDDFRGNIAKGQKSFTFKGFTCNNLFEITYRINFTEERIENFQLKMRIHFERWNNINLHALPYFDKLYKFFRHLMEGWELDTTLEIDGEDIFLGGGIDFRDQDAVKRYYKWLRYIFLVREVLKYIEEQVVFSDALFTFSEEDYDKLTEIYNIISQNNIQSVKTSMKTSLIADEDLSISNINIMLTQPTSMLSRQSEQEQVTVFGKDVLLPRIYYALTKVTPKIHTDIATIKPGQEISIEWIPEEDCEYVFGFIQSEEGRVRVESTGRIGSVRPNSLTPIPLTQFPY